ncbi:MAG: VanW family protein, partial [Oscillospiraceae bacterium]|nr:VanW family protein [Oscillospiraceae bacterium]
LEAEAAKAEARAAKELERAVRAEARQAKWRKFLHGLKVFLIVLLIVVVVVAGGSTAGAYNLTKSDTNLPKVYLDGVDVSGLTREQTMDKLKESGWDANAAVPLTVLLPADVSFELDMYESGAVLPREVAAEAAYRYGHGENWYENLLRYCMGLFTRTDVSQKFAELDMDYIRTRAEKAIAEFTEKTVDTGYEIDKEAEELRMVKGAGAMQIDLDGLCAEIETALRSGQKELDHRRIDNELTEPDFDALYTELHITPVDAYFKEGTFDVEEEIVGCTFDVEQARSIWEETAPAEALTIPLEITYPEVTAESLMGMLFRDKLGAQTTLFGGSTPERVNNIQLAVSKLNGVVIDPGETFSYNGTVGERTPEAGFKYAAAYQDGEVVQEIGGGVCQVSSTLYCAALYSNMETVEREAHYFMVNYLEWGHDATVSWPNPDFKFRNTRDYPVKIVASADAEAMTLTIEIWGTDVDGSYVEITYDRYYYTEPGSEEIAGWHVYTHRNVYDKDGNLIEVIEEPDGMYHKHT